MNWLIRALRRLMPKPRRYVMSDCCRVPVVVNRSAFISLAYCPKCGEPYQTPTGVLVRVPVHPMRGTK